MRFRIRVSSKTRPAWTEDYEVDEVIDQAGAHVWAEALVARFNKTLRPTEEPRRLWSVKMLRLARGKDRGRRTTSGARSR